MDDNGQFVSRQKRIRLADMGLDNYLLDSHRAAVSIAQMALAIGVRRAAVKTRISLLLAKEGTPTVENPDRKKRPCIGCRKPFSSESCEHRRCAQCRNNLRRSEIFSQEWSIHV